MTAATCSASPSGWPERSNDALYGLAGDFVRLVGPHSEADAMALLGQFLVGVGSLIGRRPYFVAEKDKHYLNLFGVLVGETAKGRKGTSWGHVRGVLEQVDPGWAEDCVGSGLSSGEGLIWSVRDPIERDEPIRENGVVVGFDVVQLDPGVPDKRLLVMESEFASALRVLGREGNTLSALIRCAWDTGKLRSMTKNSPAQATEAHISIIGHITRTELLRYLSSTEAANGFGNRILWLCVRRSGFLPEGGNVPQAELDRLTDRLRAVVTAARQVGEMRRDDAARRLWCDVYPQLAGDQFGLFGSMTARAEAQVMRLACLYALLDGSELVGEAHLHAALAFWRYAEQSARYIFGDALGDPIADELRAALDETPDGMTRTTIRDLFKRHTRKAEIDRALDILMRAKLATVEFEPTGGRPAERWYSTLHRPAPEAT